MGNRFMDKLPSLKSVADQVRARREQEKLTQKDLAALIGVSHTVIVALEKGRGNLRLANAWAALDALGMIARHPEDAERKETK